MDSQPWQTGEISGPVRSLTVTKPAVIPGLVRRAKRALMVVGHEAAAIDVGGEKAVDYAVQFAKASGIPIVATAHIVGEFMRRGFDQVSWMSAVDVVNRLQDPEWRGVDGGGRYDLILFMGLPYYMEWTLLSGLKHSAPHLKTVSLDRFYQPHASWSFPNLPPHEWQKHLKEILVQLKGK